jgi:hypothetical protein
VRQINLAKPFRVGEAVRLESDEAGGEGDGGEGGAFLEGAGADGVEGGGESRCLIGEVAWQENLRAVQECVLVDDRGELDALYKKKKKKGVCCV